MFPLKVSDTTRKVKIQYQIVSIFLRLSLFQEYFTGKCMGFSIQLTPAIIQKQVTITSLEIIKLINENKKEFESTLTNADFLKKIPIVLNGDEGKFSSVYKGGNGEMRPCYNFPKREACLMARGFKSILPSAGS